MLWAAFFQLKCERLLKTNKISKCLEGCDVNFYLGRKKTFFQNIVCINRKSKTPFKMSGIFFKPLKTVYFLVKVFLTLCLEVEHKDTICLP